MSPDLKSNGSSQPKILASNSEASIHQFTPDKGLEGFRRAPSGVAGEKEPTRQHEQGAGGRRAVMKRSGGLNPEPGGIGGIKGPGLRRPGRPPLQGHGGAPRPLPRA